MKIAHLAFSTLPANVGGMEVVVDRLIRQQRSLGHDVTLVTRWKQWRAFRSADFSYPALPLPPRPNLSGNPFRSVGPRWPVASIVRWIQWRHKFDVWHLHSLYPAGWMAYDALTGAGVPVVMTPHGSDVNFDPEAGYGFRQFRIHDDRVRDLVPRAESLSAISNSVEVLLRELGAGPTRISRIPNGVDAARLAAARKLRVDVRGRLGIAPETAIILSVSRNEKHKGLRFIPAALSHLCQENRDICWVVVGQGSENLRPLLDQEGVAEHAKLLPPVHGEDGVFEFPPAELVELYAAADVFAFPSLKETFGLVALEAMAAGTPVVGCDVEGIRDVISNEENGLLFDPGNSVAMASAIVRLLDDHDLKDRIIAAGLTTAATHDWASIASRYLKYYSQLVDQRASE